MRRQGGSRIIMLVVALTALLAAACGSSSSSGSGGGSSRKAPVTLGVLAPFSGIYAVAGPPIKEGVQLWLKQHGNKLGGHPVTLQVGDDQSTPPGEISAANSLIRQHSVNAVVGLVNSAGAIAAEPTLMNAKVLSMAVVANASNLLNSKSPYMFMVNPIANETAAPSAVLAQKQGWKSVVGVADNYIGARQWLDPSLDDMKSAGVNVAKRVYPAFPTSDYGPYLGQIGNADAVYPVMFGPDALGFVKQYKSFGKTAPLYSTGSMFEPADFSASLLQAATGYFAYWNYSPALKDPANTTFRNAFSAAYGHMPGGFEMQAYAAMQLLDAAYAKAGSTDPAKVRTALRQVTIQSPAGSLTLGTQQAANWNIYLMKIGKGPDGKPAMIPVGPYVKDASPNMTVPQAKAALTTSGQ